MSFIPGYQLAEQVNETDTTLVVRATRDTDGQSVIIKILKTNFPTMEELARYRREFEITNGLNVPGVIRSFELRRHDRSLYIALEDFDAISLKKLLNDRPLSEREILEITIQVATTLGHLHNNHIIHKDISPSNILFSPATGEVKLIDFGIATRFSKEQPTLQSPEVLEGTLAFMSPEQTGRMNRSLDYRSDFYSLGATLYYMLTGRSPFDAEDKLEMVHCHIAREPVPAHRQGADVPLALSRIVEKLMAKKAEDRYQSAAGIVADLEAIRLGAGGRGFEPGQRDFSEHFEIPQRLYGRDGNVETLLEAFDRVRRARAELMLVTGSSGLGKTALVREVHKPITRARGYFASGKFDQFQRGNPYSGLMAALRDLLRQILTESEARLAMWRESFNEALAPNGQIILDVLPELELIVGPQPAVAELEANEASNRFNRTIGQFLRALCAHDRAVVLFLDDLQWADTASLGLIRVLLADDTINRLLLIGAYRDNEVQPNDPLSVVLRDIRDDGSEVSSLALAPLAPADVAQLIADTVQTKGTEVNNLARLVVQKTQGNPLFVRQFLIGLQREGLIHKGVDAQQHRWVWDLDAIQSASITDNVVDLLIGRLKRLAPQTQEALQFAACMGNKFDIETLALIRKSTLEEAFASLDEAIREELIRPLSELTTTQTDDLEAPLVVREFAFQHDRVQQAAYSLSDEQRQKDVRLAIGRRLHATLSPTALSERIFEVTGHMNFGRDLILEDAERTALAALNLKAAHRASGATAYSSALSLVLTAQELLGEEGWTKHYPLTIDAFRQRASLEYLTGAFDRSAEIVAITLENAKTDLEKAEVYFTRIAQHTLLAQFQEAEDSGYNALALLGIALPRTNLQDAGQNAIFAVTEMLAGRETASIFDARDVSSPEMALAQRSLRHLTITAFLFNQELWPLIVGTSVKISLEHGNAPESALSFANYGVILGAFMGRYHDGHAFGRLALRLCDKFKGRAPIATVCLVVSVELMPWVEHVRESLPVIDRGYQDGLNTGDILWAGYLVMYRVIFDTLNGKRLDEILEAVPEQLEFNYRTNNLGAAAGIRAYQIVLSTLAGQTESSAHFAAPDMDEAVFLKSCDEHQISMVICFYGILKAQALYIFRRPAEALEAADNVNDLLRFLVNHPNLADHCLYQSLALAALHEGTDSAEDLARLERLTANLEQLKVWANSCPANYLAKRLMVEGEIARIKGAHAEAIELFDRAIDAATESQFLHDEALANELAARLSLKQRPNSRVGAMYLRDAAYAYQLWGAQRKVDELYAEFAQLLTHPDQRSVRLVGKDTPVSSSREGKSSDTGTGRLDLDTLIKAGQTISGEVMLGRLLDQLLNILIENAGAQRGVLLLVHDDAVFVEAEASVVWDESAVLLSIPLDSAQGSALVPQGIIHYALRTGEVIVVDDAQQDERFLADPYVQTRETRSVLCQPILHQREVIGLVYLENDLTNAAFTPERAHLVSLLSGQIAISIKNAELVENLEDTVRKRTEQLEVNTRFIEQTFGRYISSEIAEQLLKSPDDGLDFSGKKTSVTVLMSDLRGFSVYSDKLPPETIVKLLNNFLSEMTGVIEKHNGTIDAFIGDAVLAIFGVPFQRPDDAERAVACALEMQLAMPRVNAWNIKNGLPTLEMGIGINTGEVVAGNIGSSKRAKYGVIGSNVNLAVRIEGYTVGGQVLISEATRDAVQTPLILKDAGLVEPKGIAHPLKLFDVRGISGQPDLSLPEPDADWTPVDPPVPLVFRFVVDKKIVGDTLEGALIKVSPTQALIRSEVKPSPFSDLQLSLLDLAGNGIAGGVYGKVLHQNPVGGTFELRFTSLPAEARNFFTDLNRR